MPERNIRQKIADSLRKAKQALNGQTEQTESNAAATPNPTDLRAELKSAAESASATIKEVDDKTIKIPFLVDTVSHFNNTAGFYVPGTNEIVIYYHEDSPSGKTNTEPYQLLTTVVHERQHMINHKKGLMNYEVSHDQYIQLACDNEISANIAELLALRQEYLKSDPRDLSIFDKGADGKFQWYKDYITGFHGHVVGKDNLRDFEEEMVQIGMQTKKMWYDLYYPAYCRQFERMADRYVEDFKKQKGREPEANESNFRKCHESMMTIGGVDFSESAAAEDYQTQWDIKSAAESLAFLHPYSGKMSKEEYKQLLMHHELSDLTAFDCRKELFEHRNEPEIQAQIIEKYKNILSEDFQRLSKSQDFQNLINKACEIGTEGQKVGKGDAKEYQRRINKLYVIWDKKKVDEYEKKIRDRNS